MSSIEEFDSLLKEVVIGKRLSASRMSKLTDISMKLMDHDTQLVSALYRTHKSLPTSSKISSLYVFDALCRAARSQVTKQNLTGDIHAERGNCATFLLKIEGVLDGLFQDMLSSGNSEAKEKTRKILDIWTKANTFPANVLTHLSAMVRATEGAKGAKRKEFLPECNYLRIEAEIFPSFSGLSESTAPSSMVTIDPRKHPTPPSEVTPGTPTSVGPAQSAQAALLALLSSAAAANNHASSSNQTIPNIPPPRHSPIATAPPASQQQQQLEQIQLALLQQLASKTGQSIAAAPVAGTSTTPISPFVSNFPVGNIPSSTLQPLPPLNAVSALPPSSSRFDGQQPSRQQQDGGPVISPTQEQSGDYDEDSRYSSGSRGGYRGRGRRWDDSRGGGAGGRGGRFGGDRHRERGDYRRLNSRERERDRERGGRGDRERDRSKADRWSPSHRDQGSRSRSPPPSQRASGGRRDVRTYSPPRRPSITASNIDIVGGRVPPPGASEAGKDEFGRDIRPASEEPEAHSPSTSSIGRKDSTARDTLGSDDALLSTQEEVVTDTAIKDSHSVSETQEQLPRRKGAGSLETFDIAGFDPTSAESWKALGDAFQVTHGYVPSQEELIQLIMGGMGMMGMGMMGTGMDMGVGVSMDASMDSGMGMGTEDYSHMSNLSGQNTESGQLHETTGGAIMGESYHQGAEVGGLLQESNGTDGSNMEQNANAAWMNKPTGTVENDRSPIKTGSGGAGGQMKKVGDRWMFVRNGTEL